MSEQIKEIAVDNKINPTLIIEPQQSIEVHNYLGYVMATNSRTYSHPYFENAIISNTNHANICYFEGLENLGNPTILLSSIFSNHLDNENRTILDAYYLELMFESSNSSFTGTYDNFCYIFEDTANIIIENSNGEYKEYKDLINKPILLNLDGEIYSWKIANIIINSTGFSNSFQEIFGFSVLAYTYIPSSLKISLVECFHDNQYENYKKILNLNNFSNSSEFVVNTFNFNLENIDSIIRDNFSISYPFYIYLSIEILIFSLFVFMVVKYKFYSNKDLVIYSLNIGAFISTYSLVANVANVPLNFFSFYSCAFTFLIFILQYFPIAIRYFRGRLR